MSYYLYKQCHSKATLLLPVCCVLAVCPAACGCTEWIHLYTNRPAHGCCCGAEHVLALLCCLWYLATGPLPCMGGSPIRHHHSWTTCHLSTRSSVYSQRLAYNSISTASFLIPTVRGLFTTLGGNWRKITIFVQIRSSISLDIFEQAWIQVWLL